MPAPSPYPRPQDIYPRQRAASGRKRSAIGIRLEIHPAQRRHTLREEAANALTHGFGAVLGIVGLIALLFEASRTGSAVTLIAVGMFGLTLVLVYLSSMLHHSSRNPRQKQLFLLFDHCSIFLLIAGSNTPFALVSLRPEVGTALFVIIWALAVVGVGFTMVSFLTPLVDRYDKALLVLYLAMGWFSLFWAGEDFLNSLPADCITWLMTGGLVYTAGVAFYHWKLVPYSHAVWHLFAVAGSACHFYAVYNYVAPVTA